MILHNRIITIIFIFIALAISFFIGIPTTVSAACTIADGNAKFVNHHGDQAETWYSAGSRTLNIKVTATDCVGQALDIKLMEVDLTSNDVIEELEITVPSNGIIDIAILAGENYCSTTTLGSANDCELYLAVHLAGSSTVLHTSYPHPQGRLNYECAGECADAWEIVSSTPAVNVGSTNTAGTSCEIQSAKFMNYHGVQSDTWFSDEYARLLHIQIIAPDCANEKIYPSLTEVDNIPFVDLINDDVNELDDRDVRVPANGKLDLYIWVGEAECEQTVGADCDLYLEIQTSANADGISFGPTYSSYEEPQGRLRYDCDDGCLNWWKLASTINADKTVNNNVPNVCNVTNASFSPSGTQEADFYSDELQPLVEVAIQTEHCTGHPIKVSVVNKSRGDTTVSSAITGGFVGGVMLGPAGIIPGAITAVLLDGDNNVQAIDEKEIRVPSSGLVTMALKVGEDHCSFVSETGGYEQCIYYLQITNPAGYTFTFLKENSVLNYKCTGTVSGSQTNCAPIKKWNMQSHNGLNGSGESVYNNPTQNVIPLHEGDPCTITTGGETIARENCYALLEPIGNVAEIDFGNTSNPFTLGDYVNLIVGIVIGIASLLAVVMLVVGGVQYMTTDALAGKSNARETITKALLGLVLALGSYLILKTINPNLLKIEGEGGLAPKVSLSVEAWGDIQTLSPESYENITGKPLPTNAETIAMAEAAAESIGVEQCVALTLLAMESKGQANAIGHDENVEGTRSYGALSTVDKLYTGNPKTAGTWKKNDDTTLQPGEDHLGLDWRFSHGIGAMQITFFPAGYNNSSQYQSSPPPLSTKTTVPSRTLNGVTYTPVQMLDPELSLTAGLRLWKQNLGICEDIRKAFVMYNGGSCNTGGRAQKYGDEAKVTYDSCKEQTSQLASG